MAQEVLKPLTTSQLKELLSVQPNVVLVGGQALAFWADYYKVIPSGALEAGVTRDIDFIGRINDAETHAISLTAKFPAKVSYTLATIDTPPPSVAVIMLKDAFGNEESIVIDYVSALIGYTLKSEAQLRRHAVPVDIDSVEVLVMHPFDCLKSRVHNLIQLPSKKNELGLEQLRLAVQVVREYLQDQSESQRGTALPVAEAVIELAQSRDGVRVRREFGINVLDAIPVERMCQLFQDKRWPQVVEYMARRFHF